MTGEAKSVLLIEDNPDDVELALQAFRRTGLDNRVVVSPDADSALAYLASPTEPQPTIVLLDLNLPGMSGRDVLRAIRSAQRTRLIPVIVLSTSREPRDVLDAYEVGANSYIVKTTDFETFIATATLIARYWLQLNETPEPQERTDAHTIACTSH